MSTYSLDQIKSHPNFPFDDFLTNDISFLMVELYWPELFKEIMGDAWGDWIPSQEAARDGNPVFSVHNRTEGRALRVIQKYNEESKPPYPQARGAGAYYGLQPWLGNTLTPDGEEELIELVMASDCSAQSEQENSRFIREHCLNKIAPDRLEELIVEFEQRVGMPE